MNRDKLPPKAAERLLKYVLPKDDSYTSIGDFEEYYSRLAGERNVFVALYWYWRNIIFLFPRKVYYSLWWSIIILKNYLKIALRNMGRQKGYSFINISGLTVGMTCFILIMLYVQFELSYDRFHDKSDQIYRVVIKQPGNIFQGSDTFAVTYIPMAAALIEEYPEVVNATKISGVRGELLINRKKVDESGRCADDQFLNVFTFPLVKGDKNSALKEPFTMIISENMAVKYFSIGDPVGKTLSIQKNDKIYDLKITGIIRNIPKNSHFQFDYLVSFATRVAIEGNEKTIENWRGKAGNFTYIEIQKDFQYKDLETKLLSFIKRYSSDFDKSFNARYLLQPLTDIHLKSHVNFEFSVNSDIKYVYIFSVIAFGILIIACINFMNLSTARATKRAKEVGLRKVVGARRIQLIRQFIGETILITLIALIISSVFVLIILPYFVSFTERNLEFNPVKNQSLFLILVFFIIFVGFLSGSYPALFLSSFQPSKVLKESAGANLRGSKFRSVLVIFQLSVSIILIVSTIIVFNQLNYIKHKDIGYNRDQVVVIPFENENVGDNYKTIKNEFLKSSDIAGITTMNYVPTGFNNNTFLHKRGKNNEEITYLIYYNNVDYDFLDVMGIELLEGRNFSHEITSDTDGAIVINETAARLIEGDNTLGKTFPADNFSKYRIIGVVKDFHFSSLHLEIKPMMIILRPERSEYFCVRIRPVNIPETIEFLKKTINVFSQDHSLNYYFLDDSFNIMYRDDQRFGIIFTYFSVLSIFIACLGIFGLASFSLECRIKEIGIRKILGASLPGLVKLFLKKYIILVLLANIIAWPIAYFVMDKWLQNFAYRIDINFWIFVFAAVIVLSITAVTVSVRSYKSANTNPVNSLRHE